MAKKLYAGKRLMPEDDNVLGGIVISTPFDEIERSENSAATDSPTVVGRAWSAGLCAYLLDTLKMREIEVAAWLGVHRSYVNRVRNRQASFTVPHMVTIERQLGVPIGIIMLEVNGIITQSQTRVDLEEAKAIFRRATAIRQQLDDGDDATEGTPQPAEQATEEVEANRPRDLLSV